MANFHENYIPGRYRALSVHYQTGAVELKDITGSYKHINFHPLLTIRLKSGQQVTVTDNHSVITIGEDGAIVTAVPSTLKRALIPRRLVMEKDEITFDLSGYPVSTKYGLDRLKLTPSLAKLMGLYTAEGSADGSTLYLALFDRELEEEARPYSGRSIHNFNSPAEGQETQGSGAMSAASLPPSWLINGAGRRINVSPAKFILPV